MAWILSITTVHLIACLSPGPDILLTLHTRWRSGYGNALCLILGILLGVSLQIGLGLTGVSFLLSQGDTTIRLLAMAGGAWLIYLGFAGWPVYEKSHDLDQPPFSPPTEPLRPLSHILKGFTVNILNPKAFLYFVGLFSTLLAPDLPLQQRLAAAAAMVTAQAIGFAAIAFILPNPARFDRSGRFQKWIQVASCLLFFALGFFAWASAIPWFL